MKLFLSTLVLTASFAFAQTTAGSSVQGCSSGSEGNYSFTDQSGKSWTLAGKTDDLKNHVGHMIEISGAAQGDTTYNVDSVRMIAENCQNTSASTASSTDQSGQSSSAAAASQDQAASANVADTQAAPSATQGPADNNTAGQESAVGSADSGGSGSAATSGSMSTSPD